MEDRVAREQKRMELEAVERRLAAEDAVTREVAEKTEADMERNWNGASALVEQALRTMLYDLMSMCWAHSKKWPSALSDCPPHSRCGRARAPAQLS